MLNRQLSKALKLAGLGNSKTNGLYRLEKLTWDEYQKITDLSEKDKYKMLYDEESNEHMYMKQVFLDRDIESINQDELLKLLIITNESILSKMQDDISSIRSKVTFFFVLAIITIVISVLWFIVMLLI